MTVQSDIAAMLVNMGIDPFWIIAGLAVIVVVLIVIVLILMSKVHHLTMRYDLFMRGKDCETMEDNIVEIYRKLQNMQNRDLANKDILKMMNRNLSTTISRTGLVKYNAFKGMGGQSSFALTFLNNENSGYILNAVHSRTSCYIYIKEVNHGEAMETLSDEEKSSLTAALAVESRRSHGKNKGKNPKL